VEQTQSFRLQLCQEEANSGDVAAGSIVAFDQAQLHPVATDRKDHWNSRCHRFGSERGGIRHGNQHIDLAVDQVSGERRQRKAVF